MTIVLDEHEWAKDMIRARSLGKKPFETLRRVARFYIDHEYPKKEVRKMLDSFLIQCDPSASLAKWSDTIDVALESAMNYKAIKIDSINISKNEIRTIDRLSGKQVKRLAFTLICLAKYWDSVNPKSDHWVNNKDCDIMRMANIRTSIKRQSMMYHQLREAGLIQFSKKVDNTNIRVLFIQDGDTAINVHDFRNLGYQYLKFHGEPYIECRNCGITTKIENYNPSRAVKQIYCRECASEIAMQQRINSVMRKRERTTQKC